MLEGGEVDENRVECNPLYIRSIDCAIVRFGGREYRGGEERQGEGTDKGIEYLEFVLIYFRQLERGETPRRRERKREREREGIERRGEEGILSESRPCFIEPIRSSRTGKVNKRARVPHELNLNR